MKKVIALEARLTGCKNVITLGARPNFYDYSQDEKVLIRKADKIYYPTTFYADLFDAMGKKTFPSYHTYKCAQDKIKQSALFELLEIAHPRTRVFYGKRQKSTICDIFSYPFIGKIPRGSSMGRGVFLINCRQDLNSYLAATDVAYIQDYMPVDRDIRVVVIGKKAVHAYWRISKSGEFRSNVAQGGSIVLDNIPEKALEFAVSTAAACKWDDVGIDLCLFNNKFYIIEANMKYGKEGFRAAGIDYKKLMEKLISNEEI